MQNSNQLPYLQPVYFNVEHSNFQYEVIAFKEYFEDIEGISPTGNLLVHVLTPRGMEQFTLTSDGDVWHDDDVDENSPDVFELPEVFYNLPISESTASIPHPDLPYQVLQFILEKLKK